MADAKGNSVCNRSFIEGPYNETDADPQGVNAFIRSLKDAGVEPNSNVYAEVGSAIDQVMTNPVAAQHFFGKLMKHVGVDRVVWGTDCLATRATPQQYIEWFRTLEISEQMQTEYGYPPLDAEQKSEDFRAQRRAGLRRRSRGQALRGQFVPDRAAQTRSRRRIRPAPLGFRQTKWPGHV